MRPAGIRSAKSWNFRHTDGVRRGIWLLVLGVVVAAFGAASARAAGSAPSTTPTTTTTDTTTTTVAPSYAALPPSSLPAGCVGAGAAALILPSHSVIALGLRASGLGMSAYPSSSSAFLTFDSSTVSGSACTSAKVTVSSLSLLGGAVSASSVEATSGRGTVTGLAIDGTAVTATPGETLEVDGWAELMLGATIGRVRAPLVLRLLQAHGSLPAGTAIAVAFAASGRSAAKPAAERNAHTGRHGASGATGTGKHSSRSHRTGKQRHGASHGSGRQSRKQTRAERFWSHYQFPAGGLSPAARKDAAVSIALQYLGVPYVWAGARPKTGFDCSGLVQWVFARLGVWLPHNAAAQWHSLDTVWIRPSQLKPGDLVFFKSDGTRKMPGHVGIYIGEGYLIDAPHTGAVVRIDSFSDRWFARQFVGAKRVAGAALSSTAALLSHRPHVARHLLDVDPAAFLPGFLAPISLTPVGGSIGIVAAPTGTSASALRNWAGVGLGGLLLLLLPGAFTYRRRWRVAQDSPSADSPS